MAEPAAITEKPLVVSRFEASMLRMLRAFVPRNPGELLPLLPAGKLSPPSQLSADCVYLVKDTLAKGSVLYLARAGGWRREKHLARGQVSYGRLWERAPADDLGLNFSQRSLSLLVWLASGRPDDPAWSASAESLSVGDQWLLFLAYEALRETDAGAAFRMRAVFIQHGLIRLAFPEDFASVQSCPPLDFDSWTTGPGAHILEAIQPKLMQRVLTLERSKNEIGDWARMRQVGISQDRALSAFLDAVTRANRPDLARFLLRAFAELIQPQLTTEFWIAGLQGSGPARLTDRLEVHRQALSLLRQFELLHQWTLRARATGYHDEEYAKAQIWLADWETYRGDEAFAIAQRLLRQVEPLQLGVDPQSPTASTGPADQLQNP